MNPLDALGWCGTAVVLVTYLAVAVHKARLAHFHAANVAGAPLIAASAIHHGAWPSVVVTAAFGIAGAVGVLALVTRDDVAS